jgi:hypothetical protein
MQHSGVKMSFYLSSIIIVGKVVIQKAILQAKYQLS